MIWRVLIFLALLGASSGLAAQELHEIDIRAGSLDRALVTLSHQTGASIGGIDRSVRSERSPRIKGRYSVRQALNLILRSTPFTYRVVSSGTYRIIRRPQRRRPASRPASLPPPRAPSPPTRPSPPVQETTIVVTTTKLGTGIDDYSGTAHVFQTDDLPLSVSSSGLDSLTDGLPKITQTNLGPGRNKLFIRGIADSSFNGATQSTVAQYYNDVRLTYSAPNPDLRLYDTERVEIIEGPQGSLYGAGSIGGIVRTVTKPADPAAFSASAWGGGAITQSGDESYQVAGMVNVPLSDNIAVRLLGYRQMEGGFIDDSLRGLSDVNRVMSKGGRLSARWDIDSDTRIDLVAASQSSETADSQYSELGGAAFSRRSVLAQPFENDLSLYSATFRKQFSDVSVVSATGYVENEFETRFDASRGDPATPIAYGERREIGLFSHETRATLERGRLRGLLGASFVKQTETARQFFGPVPDPPLVISSRTEIAEAALFGEVDWLLGSSWTITGGGRIVYSENTTEQIIADIEPTDRNIRLLPTAAIRWSPNAASAIYLRYQTGYRVGGFAITGGADPDVDRIESDRVQTWEAGIEYPLGSGDQLTINHRFFYTRWQDVQADLIDDNGFPSVGNIGDAKVYGVSLSAIWRPIKPLQIDLMGFANESEITQLEPGIAVSEDLRLPNIAELGASGRIALEFPLTGTETLHLSGTGQYVGTSQLGIQSFLALPQGDYFEFGGAAEIRSEKWAVGLAVRNALNSDASRFALGNPFDVGEQNQLNLLRPLSVQLNIRIDF